MFCIPTDKISARRSQLASRCIIVHFISFTVHRVHSTDEEGYICTHLSPLAVDSIEKARGYSFKREDQQIYLSKDLLEFTPRWQWPEIQLPVPQVIPQAEAPPYSANQELLRGLQSTHDSAVDFCALRTSMHVKHTKSMMLLPSWHTSGHRIQNADIMGEYVKPPIS